MFESIENWLFANSLRLFITLLVVAFAIFLDRLSTPRIIESGDKSRFKMASVGRGVHVARSIYSLISILALLAVWHVDLRGILIISTTTLTLLGAALFASWSLLSNVTAYFLLLFDSQFQRGNFIRVIDMDNYVEGYISELTLMRTKLITENREVVFYPNTLLLNRPTMINPRNRLLGVGKIENTPVPPD